MTHTTGKMNDATKIRVLMIYYQHWGLDEIQARKVVHGVQQTIALLEKQVKTYNDMFFYPSIHFGWSEMANALLHNCGGCIDRMPEYDDYDENEILFDRKVMLENHLHITNYRTCDILYEDGFGYQEILSVDAIVALL